MTDGREGGLILALDEGVRPIGRLNADVSRKLVGGPGFEPGAPRSRTLRPFVQKSRKRSVSVRNFLSGQHLRPDL